MPIQPPGQTRMRQRVMLAPYFGVPRGELQVQEVARVVYPGLHRWH